MSNLKALDNRIKRLRRRFPMVPGEFVAIEEWHSLCKILLDVLEPFQDVRAAMQNQIEAINSQLPSAPGSLMTVREWNIILDRKLFDVLEPHMDARVAVAAALVAAEEKLSNV